ncbi:MAG: ABC transporter ATP-binding protein [Magnetococcales bacterium]|nr:ABC transporter ATP-binding protein [Magnetococcales bacterium]
MSDAICHVEAVVKHYPQHRALDGVSLTLPPGICVALLGHNGAGKTTLMKLLLGLTRPTAGRVTVLGQNPATAPLAFRRQIGFLPENVIFHDELTGIDTLTYYARLKGEARERCVQLLAQVGLAEAAKRRVKTYSKGMRQRLGLAQALLGQPRLLLLDEPTTGLDPMLRQEFYRIIQALRNQGVTVMLSSHLLTELEAQTDLAIILRAGKLVACGSLSALREQANLPVCLQVTTTDPEKVTQHLAGLAVAKPGTMGQAVFVCAVSGKMATLRRLALLGELVQDVEIQMPSLDDVYLHFGQDQEVNEA